MKECCVFRVILLFFTLPEIFVTQRLVTQWPNSQEAMEGAEVTLHCNVTGNYNNMKWSLWDDPSEIHVLSTRPKDKKKNNPRVNWLQQNPKDDFSIRITNVTVKDSGVYYCVAHGTLLTWSGNGTLLKVKGKGITITGPPGRVKVGDIMNLACMVHGFDTVTFEWLKNSEAIPQTHSTTIRNGTEHVSRLSLRTEKEDIRSVIQCVTFGNEGRKLSAMFNLSSIMTVMPQLKIEKSPDITDNSLGKYSCRVDGFFPEGIQVSWTIGNHTVSSCCEKTQNHLDGTFSKVCSIQIALRKLFSGSVLQCNAGYHAQCFPKKKDAPPL
ncbi:tyrosine-protein phosphatase non-receptor type substrate 1-like [Polypterus senegalus]|uniref:tyrosine-protein phosphatase non-receptor type substrate 1-like n=1 Tax=Polypterus senegalus TaxID=55291 RepID=UPI001962F757|nr:tyrosine-protein phosphatase non-receptor type substrate 1-like [Polypterus senegalus]